MKLSRLWKWNSEKVAKFEWFWSKNWNVLLVWFCVKQENMFIPLILKIEIKSFLDYKNYFSKNHKIRIFLKGLVSPWFNSKIEIFSQCHFEKNERISIVCSLLERKWFRRFPDYKIVFSKNSQSVNFSKGFSLGNCSKIEIFC